MKFRRTLVALAATIWALAGCSQAKDEAPAAPSATGGTASSSATSGGAALPAVATGKPLGSIKVGDKAICAVCAVKEGTKSEEEVKAVLDYKGKTYGFCSLDEKAEFISNPAKYAGQ